MDIEEFREFGKITVDYIADYLETIRDKQVLSSVEPGYLQKEIPQNAPYEGEQWQDILKDVDRIIVPGLTHWHSPNFHAYMPTANSFPGIIGELFLSGLGCISKDWTTNPASVELELVMMDWLAKLLGLPAYFLNSSSGPGGGVIQNAASESTLVALLSAKKYAVEERLKMHPNLTETEIKSRLVAYTSEQSNSSVEKAGLLASVTMKLLSTDENGSLRGETLLQVIQNDLKLGLIPCCVIATLGTTGTCSFDNLDEIGPICSANRIWLHIDAAYAGSVFACPEYRYLLKGVEFADSFNFNPHKWLLVNSDCSAMWFKNTNQVEEAFKIESSLSEDDFSDNYLIPELSNWQIPNSRRFRALKIWFVLRIYGVEGIQNHIRKQIFLAKYFEKLVSEDHRFELCTSRMGVVCFRLKGGDKLSETLLEKISERKNIFLIPCHNMGRFVIRFVICSRFTEERDVLYSWNEISGQADEILKSAIDNYGCGFDDIIVSRNEDHITNIKINL